MNDGVISIILVSLFTLLLFGEWFETEFKDEGWNHYLIILILLLILISPFFCFTEDKVTINLTFFILPFIAIYQFSKKSKIQLLSMISGSLIIAAVLYFIEELLVLDPVLQVVDARLIQGLIIGVVSALLSLSLCQKWMAIILGMSIGWAIFIRSHFEEMREVTLYSFYEMDTLFITILIGTLFHHISLLLREYLGHVKIKRSKANSEVIRSSHVK